MYIRGMGLKCLVFPEAQDYYVTASEREMMDNCRRIRGIFKQISDRRRAESKDPNFKKKGDLLETLLEDEVFGNDDNVIID
mmetsp:Transcript_1426/g.926  ORF Transcript_1426/g.926 Transcript_1426/m.926 type:complete len:81 (-) Transcript_1426:416-658(-)